MNARFEKLFREEAVRHHRAGQRTSGDVLRLSPRWAAATAWSLYATLAACALYAALATVDEYVASPAIVCADGQVDLVAARAGVVAQLLVGPGQRVERGQALVRFEDEADRARLAEARRDFEAQLADMLRHADDHLFRPALAAARERLETATAAEDARIVRAGSAGVVAAVAARPGEAVEPGAPLVTLAPLEPRYSIVALLPGTAGPRLARGQTLRVTLAGYRDAPVSAIIDEIAPSVMGPSQARRALGAHADLVPIDRPVVIVRARLAADELRVDGERLPVWDGMTGTAQLRLARRSILALLVPGLSDVSRHAL